MGPATSANIALVATTKMEPAALAYTKLVTSEHMRPANIAPVAAANIGLATSASFGWGTSGEAEQTKQQCLALDSCQGRAQAQVTAL